MRKKSGDSAPIRRGKALSRHGAPSGHRWIATLARGGAAAGIACALVAVTLAAAGHVLALAVDAHSDTRSLVGRAKPAGGLAWFAEPDTTMIPLRVTATTSLNAGALPSDAPRFVLAAVSGSIGDDDVVFTGSIGGNAARFSVVRPPEPVLLDDPDVVEEPLPLPRARPRLASLTPSDLNLKLEGDPAPVVPATKTAIYDITAKTVYMPNGEKLEAHSGYGEYMDDPKYFKMRMRGVTPPNTYRLTMREALFHGHEAIRMNPENKEAMNGRAGILAHPYLLGPSGQSHGCVSFKDYSKFLAAFKRGEVDRMVVVFRMDKPPAFADKRSFWQKLF